MYEYSIWSFFITKWSRNVAGYNQNCYLWGPYIYFVNFIASYQMANGFSESYWGQAVTKGFAELRSGIPRFIAGREEI